MSSRSAAAHPRPVRAEAVRRAHAAVIRSSDDLLAFQVRQMAAIVARSPGNGGAIGDCAATLRAIGRDDLADLLLDAALLSTGLVALDEESALLTDGSPRSTILLGLDEMRLVLRQTAATAIPASVAGDDGDERATLALLPGSASPIPAETGPSVTWLRDRLPSLVGALAAALRAEAMPADLDGLLGRLHREVILPGVVPPATHPEMLDDLVARLAYAVLREGALRAYDCAFAPLGSAALLHCAVRLHPAALGPCFGNAGALFSTPRDLFDFIRVLDHDEADVASSEMVERCAVLLSSGFESSELRMLAIELGDRGHLRAAAAILARVARRPRGHYHQSVTWELRDAAIDNEDWPLAIAAQRLLVRWRPDLAVEWDVLAQLEATAGNFAIAEAIFAVLVAERGDEAIAGRLAASRSGKFGRFRIKAGFGSPPGLVAYRRARLAAERGEP